MISLPPDRPERMEMTSSVTTTQKYAPSSASKTALLDFIESCSVLCASYGEPGPVFIDDEILAENWRSKLFGVRVWKLLYVAV